MKRYVNGEFVAMSQADIEARQIEESDFTVPEPTYRELRRKAYINEIGENPDFTDTVGDILDALIKKMEGDHTDYDTIKAQIIDIKTRYPKPV